jgi:small subunit ribosomal protein S4
MAKYTDPKCKLCRREGTKLFLKGDRCSTDKCAVDRRSYPPGEHGRDSNPKMSGYAHQLREKQKVRHSYGILERQFRNYFRKAAHKKGVTGENLLQFLERRLDNIVFRLGFAPSRPAARQLVRHGHILVNNRKVDIPSYEVKPGEDISLRETSRKLEVVQSSLEARGGRVLSWLELDRNTLRGKLLKVPSREEIPLPVQEQLIVELYSK